MASELDDLIEKDEEKEEPSVKTENDLDNPISENPDSLGAPKTESDFFESEPSNPEISGRMNDETNGKYVRYGK